MKKITAAIISFLLFMSISVTAFSANVSEVYAETVTAAADKAVLIPVKIKNNPGIMGFKITVTYDKTVLTSPKVTKGDVTNSGMMNDSIGVTPEGTIDVVWSGVQNAVGDGTLMILSFTAVKAKETQINLNYSQPDTFNEAWEDVELKCSDISVVFSDKAVESSADTEKTTDIPTESNPTLPPIPENQPSSEEIKNAVDIVLGETDKGHIDEIPEEEKSGFVDRTNEVLGQITGGNNKPFESVDEIKGAYNDAVAEEFIEDTKEAVDSDKIDAAITDSLAFVGAESVEQIPVEKKEEFVQKVEEKLQQYAPDLDTVSNKLTEDEAVKAIMQLQGENAEAATDGKKMPELQKKSDDSVAVIVVAAIAVLASITTIIVVYIKKLKRGGKINEENN